MALPNHRPPIDDVDEDEDLADGRMSFLAHLEELRARLIRSCLAIAVGMGASIAFVTPLSDLVLGSIERTLPGSSSLIYTRPGEGFAFYFDIALMVGLVLAAPFVSYQVWRFIAPGLHAREKRLVVPFALLATAGSVAGALFSHFVLFPSMMTFFGAFDSPRLRFMPRIDDTFTLYRNTLIGMVVVFQIPTLIFVLARLGLVSARFLWRHLSHALIAAVVAGAILTPSTDPWNQLVFAAPMVAMYGLGIGIAWVARPRGEPDGATRAQASLGVVIAASVFEQARRRLVRGHPRHARRRISTASWPSKAARPFSFRDGRDRA